MLSLFTWLAAITLHAYGFSKFIIILANRKLDAASFVDQRKKALKTPYI
jgi:hypothetical protein